MLEQAVQYSQVLFSGAISIWLVNTLASVVRGTGDMRIPSVTLIGTAIVQVAVGGGLGLGLFGLPKLGMRGVAAGQLTAFTLGAMFLAWYLVSGRSRLKLNFAAFTFQRDMFVDILKVGAVSCLSPLQTVLTILIFTKILAGFGTETLAGYGMGSRLEFLLIPIAFAFGVASVPMVGMAMGAGLVTRARQVAWTAGAAAGLTVGLHRPGRCDLAGALGFAVHQRSRRDRGGLFLFRAGGPGVRLLRRRRLPLFLLAGCGEGRRPRAGRNHPAVAGRGRRLVAGVIGRAGLDLVCAGRRRDGRVRPRHGAVGSPDALGQMTGLRISAICGVAQI